MICGYARVSTEDQAYQVALSNQISRLRESGCQRVYVDIASRADDAREGLAKLLGDIEAGKVAEVRITRLDRITASPGLFEQLSKKLNSRSIPLKGLDEHIDIHSADGEFSAGLQIYFGKREVRTIQLRSQRGHEIRRRNKRPNASVPWGYRVVDRAYRLDTIPFLCLLEDKPDSGEFVGRSKADLGRDTIQIFFTAGSASKAVRLLHEKYGVLKRSNRKRSAEKQATSYVLGEEDSIRLSGNRGVRNIFQWTHDGLLRWLRNPVLRGHTPYKTRKLKGTDDAGRRVYGRDRKPDEWEIAYDTHPDQVLMTEEQYREIERIIKQNSEIRGFPLIGGNDRRYPISGLLTCGECGAKMKSQASKFRGGKWQNYYKCRNAIDKACPNKASLRGDRAEAVIIQALIDRAEVIAARAEEDEPQPDPPELQQLRDQLRGLEALPGANPAIETAKAELQVQIEQMTWKLSQQKSEAQTKRSEMIATLREENFWEQLTDEKKTKLFRWLIRRVTVSDGVPIVELDV